MEALCLNSGDAAGEQPHAVCPLCARYPARTNTADIIDRTKLFVFCK